MSSAVRVRFAPSPTGYLHLGNLRIALFNYLFADQTGGTFVLRIEDTDTKRNVDEAGYKIIDDLKWLGLTYHEGPLIGGSYGPYIQSERTNLYQDKLYELIQTQRVYRCFCTSEELEARRQEQIAQGKPSRYNRTCLHLSDDMIKEKIGNQMPFIWRLLINHDAYVEIDTMARGPLRFELKHFSDVALTRPDGSFTFMFANFVDDWLMEITHVIRGEDHLSNSAIQGALFDAFAIPLPIFWHLPFLCNEDGKKLSKRDFGFSLDELKHTGYLPEAICNYLGIIGSSFKSEVHTLDTLADFYDFDHIHATGPIRYDVNKLTWLNSEWISRLGADDLVAKIKPFLHQEIPTSKDVSEETLRFLVCTVQDDLKTLVDAVTQLRFYFEKPKTTRKELDEKIGTETVTKVLAFLEKHLSEVGKVDFFIETVKHDGKKEGLSPKELWGTMRYLLTGSFQGMRIHDLLNVLDEKEVCTRMRAV